MRTIFLMFFFFCVQKLVFSQSAAKIRVLAEKAYWKEDYKVAISLYNKLLVGNSSNPTDYIHRAYSFYNVSEFKKCIDDCNKTLGFVLKNDEKEELYRLRAASHFALGENEEAVEDFTACLSIRDSRFYYFQRGRSLFNNSKYSLALKDFNHILGLYLDSIEIAEANAWVGHCYFRMDSIEKAKNYLELSLRHNFFNIIALVLGGDLYSQEKNYEKALYYCNRRIKIDTLSKNGYFRRANVYYRMKDSVRAFKDYKEYRNYLIANKSAETFKYGYIAWTDFILKEYKEALIYANKDISLNENLGNYDIRGCIYYKLGDYQNAINDFNKALELTPGYSNSLYYRGLAYLKLNKITDACEDWKILLKGQKYEVPEGELSVEELGKLHCKD